MTFAVDVERPGGKRVQVPLKPGGENVPLTIANRREFVDLYTRYLLVQSVDEQVRVKTTHWRRDRLAAQYDVLLYL